MMYPGSRVKKNNKKNKTKQKQKHSYIIIHTPNCTNIFICDVIIS